jgi:hypothetical protein
MGGRTRARSGNEKEMSEARSVMPSRWLVKRSLAVSGR